jgi:HEAT repeat protein
MRAFAKVSICFLAVGHAAGQSDLSKALAEYLRGEDEEAAHAAATLLARIGEPAVPDLAPLVVESDDRTHARAIAVMVAIGRPAVPALREALGKGPRWGKPEIARALAALLGDDIEDLSTLLAQQLGDRDPGVRMEACNVLAELHERAAPVGEGLITCLRDPEPHLRHCACSALGNLGAAGAAALPALFERLHDEEPEVRQAAAGAIGAIGSHVPQAHVAIGKELVRLLDDHVARVRDRALESLAQIGPSAVGHADSVVKRLADRAGFVRLRAVWTLEAIGAMEGDKVLPALIRTLDDSDAFVSSAAALALGQATASNKVVDALVRSLGNSDPRVRANAATSLGHHHPTQPMVRAALEQRLEDPDTSARKAFGAALHLLGT